MNLEELPEFTLPVLLLGHGALAILLLFFARTSPRVRALTIRIAAGIGLLLSAGLAVAAHGSISWRGFLLVRGPALVAAAAGGCAWLISGARAALTPRVERAALVGAGAGALALASSSPWLVPTCLFALVVALAAAASMAGDRRAPHAWLGIGLGLAGVVGALAPSWLQDETWLLPASLHGWRTWLLVAGAGVLAGCIPRVGAWGPGADAGSEATPLLVGAGFVFLLRPAAAEEPWAGGALLLLALAGYVWVALADRKIGAIGAWPVLTGFGIAFTAPAAAPAVATAVLLAVAVLILMPAARPNVSLFLLPNLPLTAGFIAVSVAGATAFGRAIEAKHTADAISWSAIVVLLPVVLGTAILAARRLILRSAGGPRDRGALVAVWALTLASVAFAFLPRGLLLDAGLPGRELTGLGAAVLLGAGAAAIARARTRSAAEPLEDTDEPASEVDAPVRFRLVATVCAAMVFLGAAAGVGYLLVEGLKVGFL